MTDKKDTKDVGKKTSSRKRRKKEPVIGGVRRAMLKEAAGAKKAWESLIKNVEPDSPPYNIHMDLKTEQTIEHASFGIGFVVSVSTNKAEVLFEEGVKKLVFKR